MTSALKSALPSHLKPSALGGDNPAEFARKHHGKTQSHMVSLAEFFGRARSQKETRFIVEYWIKWPLIAVKHRQTVNRGNPL
jgi:hypothetical protein